MKRLITAGATDQTVYLFIQDSASTTGGGKTGLAYNTASLVCYYVRDLAAAAALTLATQTVTGAHSDGGFVEVDATNMPGIYRLDLSDAVCAAGVSNVVVMLKGAAGMVPLPLEIQLAGGQIATLTGHTAQTGDAYARLGAPAGASVSADIAALPTAAANADAMWDESLAGHVTAGSAGKKLGDISTGTPLDAAGIRAAVGLATANLDTQLGDLPTAAENATALLDAANGVEAGLTPREALRLTSAALAGKISGAETTTVVIRNTADTKDRITATVDADGNRTAITTDLT